MFVVEFDLAAATLGIIVWPFFVPNHLGVLFNWTFAYFFITIVHSSFFHLKLDCTKNGLMLFFAALMPWAEQKSSYHSTLNQKQYTTLTTWSVT